MNKKFKIFMICMSIIVMLQPMTMSVIAGDEGNPEIIDDENDIIGPRGNIITRNQFYYIDIISAWFFEDENEPDYLFISLKIKDLRLPVNSIFNVYWNYKDSTYIVQLANDIASRSSDRSVLIKYTDREISVEKISCRVDYDKNIITFKTPKRIIGDPRENDKLTST